MSLTRRSRKKSAARQGVTLLEICLATSLLLVALLALGHQGNLAVQAGLRAQFSHKSMLLNRSLLAERLAKADYSGTSAPQPLMEQPGWFYSIRKEENDRMALVTLRTSVWKEGKYATWSRTSLARVIHVPPSVGGSE